MFIFFFKGIPPPGMPFDPMIPRGFPPHGGREPEVESPEKRSDDDSEGSDDGSRSRRRRDRDRDRHRDRDRESERRDRLKKIIVILFTILTLRCKIR